MRIFKDTENSRKLFGHQAKRRVGDCHCRISHKFAKHAAVTHVHCSALLAVRLLSDPYRASALSVRSPTILFSSATYAQLATGARRYSPLTQACVPDDSTSCFEVIRLCDTWKTVNQYSTNIEASFQCDLTGTELLCIDVPYAGHLCRPTSS